MRKNQFVNYEDLHPEVLNIPVLAFGTTKDGKAVFLWVENGHVWRYDMKLRRTRTDRQYASLSASRSMDSRMLSRGISKWTAVSAHLVSAMLRVGFHFPYGSAFRLPRTKPPLTVRMQCRIERSS